MSPLSPTVPAQRTAPPLERLPYGWTLPAPAPEPEPPARPHAHWTLRIAVTEPTRDGNTTRTHAYDGLRTACRRTPSTRPHEATLTPIGDSADPFVYRLARKAYAATLLPADAELTCPGCIRRAPARPSTSYTNTEEIFRTAATTDHALTRHDPAAAVAACRMLAAAPARTAAVAQALARLDGDTPPRPH